MGVYGGSLSTEMTSVITGSNINLWHQPVHMQLNPNPVKDKLNLILQASAYKLCTVQLYDLNLKLMLEKDCKITLNDRSEFTLDLDAFPPGVYFLILNAVGYTQTEKVVKL